MTLFDFLHQDPWWALVFGIVLIGVAGAFKPLRISILLSKKEQ